ncbi:MAG TPA: NAD(P)H-hydrate dehydratase [Chitinophagales bacterium]|nr:NAD(P)H-hydrate dehydratase [Chitinophagales bacterium]
MIKILSAEQIREADRYTIEHEPIKSTDLMECAARAFCTELVKLVHEDSILYVFCGPGNNGGDGLAIARIAEETFNKIHVFILSSEKYSDDFEKMLKRLKKWSDSKIRYIETENDFPSIEKKKKNDGPKEFHPVIVDALFGSGLNKPLDELTAKLVDHLNAQDALRIAVDVPSGLFADHYTDGKTFHAHHTITFQHPKFSFLFPQNYESVGDFYVADIGLDKNFIDSLPAKSFLLEESDIKQSIKPRKKNDHKGKFGHAFIHAGNVGKMGAAIMCAKACACTGAGLTTAHLPKNQSATMNISIPEVMTEEYDSPIDVSRYNAFAFGPGIGTGDASGKNFLSLLEQIKNPSVLDADALNILSEEKNCWELIPENSILTPHPKEFERLAGKTLNWEEQHNRQVELSRQHSLYIILKGAYTCITTPDEKSFFNSTGNPGMAKGGSGDVLTGMIVSLLAQNYSAEDACIIGVYLHGLAGDVAVKDESEYSLLATDIISAIGKAFRKVLS